jgi:tetratricopeptide (TPR) repeat protein
MASETNEAFLRQQGDMVGWQTVASLKSEVDRLVACDLNSASRLAERIGVLAEHLGDSVSRAFAEAGKARVLHISGKHSAANTLYKGAAKAMQTARLNGEAATVQKQQVDALTQMGQYDEALRTARAARRVLLRRDPVQVAQLETNVGNIYYRLDRYGKALEHYDQARKILSRSGDDTMRAIVDANRSNVFMELDRHEEALELLASAAASFDRAGQKLFAAETRFHIAYLQFLRGNYGVALADYYNVRDQLEQLGSSHRAAWCDQEIAEILLALNAFEDSAERAAAARSRFVELDLPYESAQATLVEGLAALGLEQFAQAQNYIKKARRVFERRGNKILTALIDAYLAEIALKRNKIAEASRRADSALRVFARQKLTTRAAYARLLASRAAYGSGELSKASRHASTALELVKGLFAPEVVYRCHHLIGQIARDRNRHGAARESFRSAVDAIEQLRGGLAADEFKATFLRDKIDVYEDAIAACLDDGSDELLAEAFRLVEMSKSRALADLLARYARGTQVGLARGLQSESRAKLAKLIDDLNWYSSQAGLEDDKGDQRSADAADHYRRSVSRCERQIARMFRRLEGEGFESPVLQTTGTGSVSDLCDALEPGETVIEYFATGDKVSAFIASQDGINVARGIASKRDVDRMLGALRLQIEKFNYGPAYVESYFGQLRRATNEHLIELYNAVFAPVEGLVAGGPLIIIPHGVLHYVPFHALYDGSKYIVDRFEMSFSPSAAVLKLARERQVMLRSQAGPSCGAAPEASGVNSRPDDSMLAIGVGEHGTPSILDEIDSLTELFPNTVALTGPEATRNNVMRLASDAKFLHLASHGYFRRDNPMFSFLKLADSHLNFYSLLDFDLKAEMVTLSACHTGVNMVFPGDELHGLMRGFLYAGTPTLVASLWAVSDRSTADFMTEMYTAIRAGSSKRAALRQAQLAIKDAYGHPYYWAPFVLMGSPE